MAKSPYDYFMETLSKTNPTSHGILKSMMSSLAPSGKKSSTSNRSTGSDALSTEKLKRTAYSERKPTTPSSAIGRKRTKNKTKAEPKATKRLNPSMAQNKKRMEAMRKDANMTTSKKTATVNPRKKVPPQGTTKSKNYNVGVSKGGVSFNEAFAHFRKKGNKTFTWNGKKYTTELKKDKK